MIVHNYDNYHGINAKIANLPHNILSDAGRLIGTIGSNVGTALNIPDQNITELFGVHNYTPQAYASTNQNPNNARQQQVANTFQPIQASGSFPTANTTPTPDATGTETTNNNNNNDQSTGPSAEQQLIDENYNQIMNYLGGLEGSARSGYNSITGGINQNYNTSRTNLDATHQGGVQQINQSQAEGEQRKQDALVAARRLYNELIQGGQQRFGGASSAGEAYAALTGRELQRNNQSTENQFQTFMGQIATAKNNLQIQFENGMRSLEQQRNDALQQAQRDYQSKLDEINARKTMAATDKNNAQLSALQQLRNNIYQINVATAENSGTLQNFVKQQEAQLSSYEQNVQSKLSENTQNQTAYNTNTNLDPTTELAVNTGGVANPTLQTGQISQGGAQERDKFGNLLYAGNYA